MRATKFTPVVALISAAAFALAACGSSDADAGKSGGGSEKAAASQKRFDQYTAKQSPIKIEPLPSPPRKGMTVAITTCPLPACHVVTDAAEVAAKELGWTVKSYESDLTPEAYVATMTRVVNDKPDLVAYTPVVPDDAVADQLSALAKADVPIVVMAPAGDRPSKDGPVSAAVTGLPHFYKSGQLMGDAVVADGGTGEETVFVWYPALASIWNPVKDGVFEALAPVGSEPDVLEAATSGIGKDVPGQIVSYLQSHPKVKYVVFALADYTAGVPQALSAAGIDGVKLISRAPQPANLENIKNGSEFASVGEETAASGWRAIDALARLSLGETPDDSWLEPEGWHQIFIADNVTDTSQVPVTPGFPNAFSTAWSLE